MNIHSTNLKAGDSIIIAQDTCGHGFPVGSIQVVHAVDRDMFPGFPVIVVLNGEDCKFFTVDDAQPLDILLA